MRRLSKSEERRIMRQRADNVSELIHRRRELVDQVERLIDEANSAIGELTMIDAVLGIESNHGEATIVGTSKAEEGKDDAAAKKPAPKRGGKGKPHRVPPRAVTKKRMETVKRLVARKRGATTRALYRAVVSSGERNLDYHAFTYWLSKAQARGEIRRVAHGRYGAAQ